MRKRAECGDSDSRPARRQPTARRELAGSGPLGAYTYLDAGLAVVQEVEQVPHVDALHSRDVNDCRAVGVRRVYQDASHERTRRRHYQPVRVQRRLVVAYERHVGVVLRIEASSDLVYDCRVMFAVM